MFPISNSSTVPRHPQTPAPTHSPLKTLNPRRPCSITLASRSRSHIPPFMGCATFKQARRDLRRSPSPLSRSFSVPPSKAFVDERDVSMDRGFREELAEILGTGHEGSWLPRVFANGRDLGGAEEVGRLHEAGELGKALEDCSEVYVEKGGRGGPCQACGDVWFVLCERCSGSSKVYIEKEVEVDEEEEEEEEERGDAELVLLGGVFDRETWPISQTQPGPFPHVPKLFYPERQRSGQRGRKQGTKIHRSKDRRIPCSGTVSC